MKNTKSAHHAKKRCINPFIKRIRSFVGENANGAFVVLIVESVDDNLGDSEFAGDKSVSGHVWWTIRAVVAQGLNSLVNIKDRRQIQETLKGGDGSKADVERVGVCNSDCIHFVSFGSTIERRCEKATVLYVSATRGRIARTTALQLQAAVSSQQSQPIYTATSCYPHNKLFPTVGV